MKRVPGCWPLEIVAKGSARVLAVTFDDKAHFDIPFELLRIESPSAEVQGHHAAEKKLIVNKHDVQILSIEPVGRYAVRIEFDDGHDSGIFTWDWLYRLGHDQDALMATYRTLTFAREAAR